MIGESARRFGGMSVDLQLLVLVTVVEERNFTRAAQKLHISQPAISQHIHNLERRLGSQLLDRTNKYVRLNKAGEIAYRHAKEALKLDDQMQRLIVDLKERPQGPLKIGASFTFGEYILPHLIAEFRTRYPDIRPMIEIENTQHVLDSVTEGDIDIGIIEGMSLRDHDVIVEPIAKDTVVIVASSHHPLSSSPLVTAQEIAAEPWIVREIGSGTREITDYAMRFYGIEPAQIIEYASTQIIKESVAAGLGITILSKWAIRRELAWKTFVELKLGSELIHRPFSIVLKRSDFQTKATQLFRTFVHEQSPRLNQFQP